MREKLFMKRNLNKLLFIFIIVIAVILRFWQLGNVPPSPDWDEASLGYNAYSILESGRDEYGKSFPVILRSFDDYKPALYAYLIIPFINIFGLNVFTVRLPAAIFGIIAVITTYFLVKELFDKQKHKEQISLLSAFLLAISPWHLQFSRIAFEAQVGLALNLLALLFFLKGLRRNTFFVISAIFAGLSIYVYQSEKVYLPILFFILALIYAKDLLKTSKTWLLLAITAGIIICSPMLSVLISDSNSLMRARGVSVFSDQTRFLMKNAEKYAEDKKSNNLIGIIVDNRRVEYAKAIISGYISHFDFNWLFIKSDIERHHAPGMGLLYLFELPFLLIGIYILFFWPFPLKTKLTIFAILLIAPIPASITSGVPHSVRTINFLPTFQIFVALGLIYAVVWISNLKYQIKKVHIKYFIFPLFILVFVFNFLYYLNQYFVQQNYFYSESWQYGYKQAIEFVVPIKDKYKKIVVSNEPPLDQSYIFFLFYTKYNPTSYQKLGGTISGGFAETHSGFDKYTFRPISYQSEESGNLIIGRPEDFPEEVKSIKIINYLNGKPAIKIVEKE